MAVSRYEDLDCWQLANELKRAVYELIDCSPAAARDFRFRDQLRDAAGSGPANLAEAFGYYHHGDSARFARIAKASLTETHNHLLDGVDRRFWTTARVEPAIVLARRAIGATVGWIRRLSTTSAPRPKWDSTSQGDGVAGSRLGRRDRKRRNSKIAKSPDAP